MSAESPFIIQATQPRLTNVLAMAGLVSRRCHRPSIEQGVGSRTTGMTVFELLDSYTSDQGRYG